MQLQPLNKIEFTRFKLLNCFLKEATKLLHFNATNLDPLIAYWTIVKTISLEVMHFLIFTIQQIVAKKKFTLKRRIILKNVKQKKSTD